METLGGFSADRLASYREELLTRSVEQARFVSERVPEGARILELACGNGRLLLALHLLGALSAGVGMDLARSRIEFASAWARDLGAGELEFTAGDMLGADLGKEEFDAALCITGALAYFEPLGAGTTVELLSRMRRALAPGGVLVLELYPHPEWVTVLEGSGGEARLWQELPEPDPWRYYLSHLRLEDGVLHHAKTFVHRSNGEVDEGRNESLRLWSAPELEELLAEAGFEHPELYGAWSGAPYSEAEDELLIAAARRADG